jgi:hypothetical protein
VNDPFGTNLVPAWGIGEQTQCQSDLEVGDPLARNDPYRILASNGFTYHLQELANFSWFFGGPSTAANGWYSNGATFLTDAGPVCQDVPSMTGSLWHFSERTPAMQ